MTTPEEKRKYRRAWELRNPEKVREKTTRHCEKLKSKYKDDPEFRAERLAYRKAYYEKNKEAIYARRSTSKRDHDYNETYNRSDDRRRFHRNRKLRDEYGMTIEQYEMLLAQQNGGCAICGGTTAFDKWKSGLTNLQVDHCHSTGKVRGLLCFHCNTGLGHFRDNVDLLAKALAYLKFNSA